MNSFDFLHIGFGGFCEEKSADFGNVIEHWPIVTPVLQDPLGHYVIK